MPSIRRLIPVSIKSILNRYGYELYSAHQMASTSKRLDICAAQIAQMLHLSTHGPLENKVCLEIGAGWVLSHALIFYLLGAKKVITTDLSPHAHPRVLKDAVRKSIISIPRDILAPFSDHSQIRERMDNLLCIDNFSLEVLRGIGIEYISPVDLARDKLNEPVDFIYSVSVLEHVPCQDISLLLSNCSAMLSPEGTMLHAFHLEDHQGFNSPFDFLSQPENTYTREQQSNRGNRIRSSQWMRLFNEIPGTTSKPIWVYHRRDKPLPQWIDSSISYVDEEDLRVSHLCMFTKKA